MKSLRELLAVSGLVFAVLVVSDFYSRLPERIATHFDAMGVANGYGSRSTLWVLVGIASLLYVVLSLISIVPRRMSLRRQLSPEREKEVWTATAAMVGWIKAEMCWMFAYLCLGMVRSGMGLQIGLGWWLLPVMLVVVLGTCAIFMVRIFTNVREY